MVERVKMAIIYINTALTVDNSTPTVGNRETLAFKIVLGAVDASVTNDTIKYFTGTYNDSTQIWGYSNDS